MLWPIKLSPRPYDVQVKADNESASTDHKLWFLTFELIFCIETINYGFGSIAYGLCFYTYELTEPDCFRYILKRDFDAGIDVG